MTEVWRKQWERRFVLSFNVLRKGANDPAEWFPEVFYLPRVKE